MKNNRFSSNLSGFHESTESAPLVNKWVVAITVMFGAFMSVMDLSVVNVAMPHMMGGFSEDISSITWVATSYSIAEIILISMTGWLTTLIGRKRLYLFSFGLFTVGSVLCGTATTFYQMLLYRAIQGVGGGALLPVSQAILRESFPPEEQGIAMSIFGMGVMLAPAIGPMVGGWLTDHFGWPWIFYINIPFSIVGIFMVWTFVHDPGYLKRGIQKIDWGGILLMSVSLTTMQIVLERGERENWFESHMIIIGTAVCILSLIALVYWELKIREPIINFRLLKNLSLSLGSVMGLVFSVALYGVTFVIPQLTQNLQGYPAFQAGMVLAPRALMLIMFMPIVGRLYNHVEARWLVLVGVLITFWSYYDLSRLSLNAGFWNFVPMLLIMGAGMPFIFVTLSTVSLSTISRPQMTEASSLYTLARRVGGNIGYAMAATIVSHSQQVHRVVLAGYVNAFSPLTTEYRRAASAIVNHRGFCPQELQHVLNALISMVVNRHATMMAYNDTSLVFGVLFLCTIPLALMLPTRK